MLKNDKYLLDKIRIVLINTSHPGNIGSAARAMKTMGLAKLVLVKPKLFPHEKAFEMASGAEDVLRHATHVDDLREAIADCNLILGTSARMRAIPWPVLTPREMANHITQEYMRGVDGEIAILFGCEQWGLTNEELHQCHYHIQIPANPVYSSLNLAAAVQIICYELQLMSIIGAAKVSDVAPVNAWDYPLASNKDMELFFSHLEETLVDAEFLKQTAPRQLMTRLRRLFLRIRPDFMEMNILRGMLRAFQEKMARRISSN